MAENELSPPPPRPKSSYECEIRKYWKLLELIIEENVPEILGDRATTNSLKRLYYRVKNKFQEFDILLGKIDKEIGKAHELFGTFAVANKKQKANSFETFLREFNLGEKVQMTKLAQNRWKLLLIYLADRLNIDIGSSNSESADMTRNMRITFWVNSVERENELGSVEYLSEFENENEENREILDKEIKNCQKENNEIEFVELLRNIKDELKESIAFDHNILAMLEENSDKISHKIEGHSKASLDLIKIDNSIENCEERILKFEIMLDALEVKNNAEINENLNLLESCLFNLDSGMKICNYGLGYDEDIAIENSCDDLIQNKQENLSLLNLGDAIEKNDNVDVVQKENQQSQHVKSNSELTQEISNLGNKILSECAIKKIENRFKIFGFPLEENSKGKAVLNNNIGLEQTNIGQKETKLISENVSNTRSYKRRQNQGNQLGKHNYKIEIGQQKQQNYGNQHRQNNNNYQQKFQNNKANYRPPIRNNICQFYDTNKQEFGPNREKQNNEFKKIHKNEFRQIRQFDNIEYFGWRSWPRIENFSRYAYDNANRNERFLNIRANCPNVRTVYRPKCNKLTSKMLDLANLGNELDGDNIRVRNNQQMQQNDGDHLRPQYFDNNRANNYLPILQNDNQFYGRNRQSQAYGQFGNRNQIRQYNVRNYFGQREFKPRTNIKNLGLQAFKYGNKLGNEIEERNFNEHYSDCRRKSINSELASTRRDVALNWRDENINAPGNSAQYHKGLEDLRKNISDKVRTDEKKEKFEFELGNINANFEAGIVLTKTKSKTQNRNTSIMNNSSETEIYEIMKNTLIIGLAILNIHQWNNRLMKKRNIREENIKTFSRGSVAEWQSEDWAASKLEAFEDDKLSKC